MYGSYQSGRPCIPRTAAAMLRHMCAAAGWLLSAAFLARARAMPSAAVPCPVMRFRAARATSRSIAMSDYGAHGDRFANKKPTASLPQGLQQSRVRRLSATNAAVDGAPFVPLRAKLSGGKPSK
jgi:hypothetical protein